MKKTTVETKKQIKNQLKVGKDIVNLGKFQSVPGGYKERTVVLIAKGPVFKSFTYICFQLSHFDEKNNVHIIFKEFIPLFNVIIGNNHQ